jgi:hypothetical protein
MGPTTDLVVANDMLPRGDSWLVLESIPGCLGVLTKLLGPYK